MKKCKGNFRTNHFEGCGLEKHIFKYGLCQSCTIEWTQTTEDGKAWLEKQTAFKRKKNEAQQKRDDSKKKKQAKIDLMSTNKYRSEIFQPKMNLAARLIDFGNPCIATGDYGKENGGHYISQKANVTIAANLHNIHIQSFQSNHFQSGDLIKYQSGIREVYGENYLNFMESLRRTPELHYTKIEYMALNPKVAAINLELKKDNYRRTPMERIEMRNKLNELLGIYTKEFAVYDPNIEY